MKKLPLLVLAAGAAALLTFSATAQVTKGKTRAATTHQLMEGLVGPNCGALGEGIKAAPADDDGWKHLATNAALLNEAGHLLMDDGRCPDGEWAKACELLRTGSAGMLAKLEAKDLAGAGESFAVVAEACASCHKAHKKD